MATRVYLLAASGIASAVAESHTGSTHTEARHASETARLLPSIAEDTELDDMQPFGIFEVDEEPTCNPDAVDFPSEMLVRAKRDYL